MKNTFTHLINSRGLTTFKPITDELSLNKQNNYLFDLSHLTIVDIIGEKSLDFLQGQLTCDMRLVSDIQMIQGAQCNLKGRILSLMDIINWNGFKLILPNDLAELTQNSLNKTAQLSRVSIQKNNEYKIFGFYLQNQTDILPDSTFLPTNLYAQAHSLNYCYYHLGNGFYIFIVKADLRDQFCQPFINQDQFLGSLTWHTLSLYNNQINIYPESRGLFLPHRLGLHETQYLSFNKGCYKGQEIITRMHYKSTVKHEKALYMIKTDQRIYSGQKLFKVDEEREVGELVDYSDLGENRFLVVVSILKESVLNVRFEGVDEPVLLETWNID